MNNINFTKKLNNGTQIANYEMRGKVNNYPYAR
jgi:hypothetical protein